MTDAAYHRAYRKQNRTRINAYARAYRARDIERVRAKKRAYYSRNREAILVYQSEWRGRNPNYQRAVHLKRRYDMSIGEYEAVLAAQRGCAICHSEKPGGRTDRFHVDHVKDSKIVRGLLCYRHNVALGLFGHDPKLLREAALYLERVR